MNFEEISRQFINAIRGKTSCATLSRKLGYTFNKVARWEGGRTRILWTDFVSVSAARKVDLRRALDAVNLHPADLNDFRAIIQSLVEQHKPKKIAEMINCSPQKLNRWANGDSALNLSDFLKIIHFQKNSLTAFVTDIVPLQSVPALYKIFEMEEREKDLHAKYPQVGVLLRALELREYLSLEEHSSLFLEKKIGVSAKLIEQLLNELEEVQAIEKKGDKFVIKANRARLGFGHDPRVHQIKKFWLDYAVKANARLSNRQKDWPGDSFFSYNVFSISKGSWLKIAAAHARFYTEMKGIMAEDTEPADCIKVFNANFIDIADVGVDS